MWAIIDARAPKKAIEKLKNNFDVLEFYSDGITYKEISGHPDVFIFQNDKELIIAPNSPNNLFSFLNKHKVKYTLGNTPVGRELTNSTQYNCLSTDEYIFHKKGFTDKKILEKCSFKKEINLPQAYTRCSLFKINNNNFITSDKGIEKKLNTCRFNTLLVNPKSIILPGYPYGFFGGTAGMYKNKIYIIGSLSLHKQGKEIKNYILKNKLEIEELYMGALYDGGGIFFG